MQGFSGLFGTADDRLQNDAQTVVNFLSDGAVVDAIMSIERKNQQQDDEEDEDPTIRKIDVTNPPSKKRDQPVSALVRCCPSSEKVEISIKGLSEDKCLLMVDGAGVG